MTTEIVDKVLHLPREERAFLAEKLLESLDFEEAFPVSREWMDEIHRRCRELDEGKVKLIPAEEVFDDIHRELK
jgi:putative addiction module component (TIGR02574 family)